MMNILIQRIIIIGLICSIILPVSAMRNPSAVYCTALGYAYSSEPVQGGDIGYCTIPGAGKVDATRFMAGEVAPEHSYCALHNLHYQVLDNRPDCPWAGPCLFCTTPDGKSAEVTSIMNLSFAETICGDNFCRTSENSLICPQDCPSGGFDGYCDSVRDRICDPDCQQGGSDPDCYLQMVLPFWPLLVVIIIFAFIVVIIIWKRLRKGNMRE